MKCIIIIPVFNPPKHFSKLLINILDNVNIPIVVVDDGSRPSLNIPNKNIILKLLTNEVNKGKGSAMLKGFKYAAQKGFTHAITLDADFQHDPKFIPSFLNVDENIAIVTGNRIFNNMMPFHRRFSNIITSIILSFICKTKILDSQCGYRRYRLEDLLNETFIERGFQFESEVLIKELRKGLKIYHIEIPTIYAEESSSINHLHDTWKFIKLIIRTLINNNLKVLHMSSRKRKY